MNNVKAIDMTHGPILSKLLLVAIPIMATAFLQMTHNLVDIFWLSRLSTEAVAAAGGGGLYIWLSMSLMFIGRMGAEIGVSQNIGSGDIDQAKKYANNGYLVGLVLGILFGLILFFGNRLLVVFYGIDDLYVITLTEQYLVFISFSIPFMYMKNVISGFYTGFGDTKTPFVMNTCAIIINIILTPIFVFLLDMGVIGAALSTTVAHIVSFFVFVIIVKTKKNTPFGEDFSLINVPSMDHIKQIFKWGMPIALESGLFTILTMIVVRFIAGFGTEALAVNRVGSQIEALSWLVGSAFASAAATFIGQNWGAKNFDRLRQGFKTSVYVMLIWGIIVTLFMFIFAYQIMSIFFSEAYELYLGVMYMRIISVMQISACIEGVAAGSFRGRGLTVQPSIVSIVCNAGRVILCYVLGNIFGLAGIWWGLSIGAIIRGGWILVWYVAKP